MQVFRTVEGWLRAWNVPADARTPPLGASVTLRLDGAIAGRGQQSTPGVRALAEAVTQAMTEAAARLPIERDALYDENVRAAAARMTISLELAGPLVPITAESWESPALELAWGLDGVAARFGEQTAAMFPGAMLTAAGGMDPGRALAACVSRASGDPTLILKKPPELAKEHGAVYYRFRVTHLAQAVPNVSPDFLHRGGRVVESRSLSETTLWQWADDLAANLMQRRWPGPERYGLQGAYDPLASKYDAPYAGPFEQALAIGALARYSRAKAAAGGVEQAEAAAVFARLLFDAACQVEEGEIPVWGDATAAAATLQAISVLEGTGPDLSIPDGVVDRIVATIQPAYDPTTGWSADAPPAGRAMIAQVMTAKSAFGVAEPQWGPIAEAAVRSLYQEGGPERLVSYMPWLGEGELTLAEGQDTPLPGAVALREMRGLVWEHQLRDESLSFNQRDLAGGIVFTAARNPLPSWQSARPLTFIATMLGDPRLTDDKRVPGELARLLPSLRFLRQLTADDTGGWMYPDPTRARGGVRVSLWDQRMPVEATAMTLMTVCETLRSLDAVKARRAPFAPAPP